MSFAAFVLALPGYAFSGDPIRVSPSVVQLHGNFAQCQLLVTAADRRGAFGAESEDMTSTAQYASSAPGVFKVSNRGRLSAVGDGKATVQVSVGDTSVAVPVTVQGVVSDPTVDYRLQVGPLLSKAGCNMGACHASQHGKGGFVLSVVGFDQDSDHRYIVRDRVQRRVDFLRPEQSLILLKPSMQVPHGGGLRLDKDSADYQMLVAWLASKAPGPRSDAPEVTALSVAPPRRVGPPGMTQQLRVEATYSDGSVRDVTSWAKFDSLDEGMLEVDDRGWVAVIGQGQAPIMIRFEGQAAVAMFSVPYADRVDLAHWENHNRIDKLAANKFRELGIQPSPLCDDATFLRRVFLDCIGSLPSVEEAEAFLESGDADKRDKLVDRLLGLTGDPALDSYNDRYAAFWSLKWSDLIRNNSNDLGEQGMWALHNWIRESFRTNRPFDQFVRELVTAKGSIYMNGPANFFRINRTATDLTEATSQLFLGIRLECAKCHHHPFEKYSQADYYSFAAFFSRVGLKNSEEFGLFGREQVVLVRSTGDVRHPRSGQVMQPRPLDGDSLDHPLDRRMPLAGWLTATDNHYFAESVVNRYVAYLLGRGLVEPVDDLRSTNPPTNPELMDALAEQFVESGFDLKQLIRMIVTSRLYQTSSVPTPENASDDRFFSHFRVKRLAAEPLLDAVDQATGSQTKFKNLPLGTRAIELPDAEYPNYFLTTFGKPRRVTVCECERSSDESLGQALHTLIGDTLANKIADRNGRVAKLLEANTPHDQIVEQLYLAALARRPSDGEREACKEFLKQSPSPKECYEDLLWALLNSKQFLFVH